MSTLLSVALGVVHEIFGCHEQRYDAMPFWLLRNAFQEDATRQYPACATHGGYSLFVH